MLVTPRWEVTVVATRIRRVERVSTREEAKDPLQRKVSAKRERWNEISERGRWSVRRWVERMAASSNESVGRLERSEVTRGLTLDSFDSAREVLLSRSCATGHFLLELLPQQSNRLDIVILDVEHRQGETDRRERGE